MHRLGSFGCYEGDVRPTILVIVSLMATLSAGCTVTVPQDTTPSSTAPEEVQIDLRDLATQRALGSPPPDDVVWQRPIADATVVGLTAAAEPAEIDVLTAAYSDLPETLRSIAGPRLLVRVHEIAGAEDLSPAVTVTYGPDVYLLDRTFAGDNRTTGRLDLSYALAHELAHVAQWYALDPTYVRRVLDGELNSVRLATGSQLVRDFAAAAGWEESPTTEWTLQGSAPTEYAATSPVEDLAETVALAVTGRADWLDDARLQWVENWLGIPAEELSAGRPWLPAGAEEILSASPLYDEAAAETIAAGRGATHIEPSSFVIEGLDVAALTTELTNRLRERGLDGTLGMAAGTEFPRHQGSFVRADGVVLMVELWDLDEETVLTYVVIW